MLMYSYQITNVPKWVAAKLQSAITKNMTLPSCADVPLPYLMPIDHPAAAQALPAFLASLHPGLLPLQELDLVTQPGCRQGVTPTRGNTPQCSAVRSSYWNDLFCSTESL